MPTPATDSQSTICDLSTDRPFHRSSLAGALLIACAALLGYFASLHGDFIFDDHLLLSENALIKAPGGLLAFWYTTEQPDYVPLTSTTLWLEWRLWGRNPTGYHVTNLGLHVAACLLLWVLLRRLSIAGGFLAALLFAIHPVNVESVAWIEQRKNTLSMLFFLLSILWYLRAEDLGATGERREGTEEKRSSGEAEKGIGFRLWYWLSLGAFALAMFAKGSVAVLPLVLLLIVWWRRERITSRDLLGIAPFFLIAAIMTPVIFWFVTRGTQTVRHATFTERLLGAGTVPWFYLSKALAPIHLVFIYPYWDIRSNVALWWLPLAATAIVTSVLFRRRHSGLGRSLLFAWSCFCVALLPVLGFTDPGFMKYSLVADHYQHIALLAVVALIGAGWSAWHDRTKGFFRGVASMTAAIVVMALTFLTWQQDRLYGSAIDLYQATLRANPNSALVHNELGSSLTVAGRLQEALAQHELALQLNPNDADIHNNLGVTLYCLDRFPEAIAQFHEAIRLKPNFPNTYFNLGNALLKINRLPEAIEQYTLALQLDPNYLDALANMAIALANAGRLEDAVEEFQKALRLEPDNVKLYSNLTKAYAALHRSGDAIATAQRALVLARSQGDAALAQQIEAWLANYRVQQSNQGATSTEGKPAHSSR